MADSDLHLQQVNHKAILLLSYFSLLGEQIFISTSPSWCERMHSYTQLNEMAYD